MNPWRAASGEFVGTFVLVFLGCGTVATSILYGWFPSLSAVALMWGLAVVLGILSARKFGPAHLNPAVSLASTLDGTLSWRYFGLFTMCQLLAALCAAATLYALVSTDIELAELASDTQRNSAQGRSHAMMFGEFFPNPAYEDLIHVSWWKAAILEMLGTAVLVGVIYRVIGQKNQLDLRNAMLIGLCVTLIISLIAPYTQAGINPARDFGPRLFAYFAGWEHAAFADEVWQSIAVYVAAPFVGAALATWIKKRLIISLTNG